MLLRFSIIIVFKIFVCSAVSVTEYSSMPKLFHLDNYDECMTLEDKALYCTFTFELQLVSKEIVPEVWFTIKNVSDDPRNYRHDKLRHGICVPKTCSDLPEDYKNMSQIQDAIRKCYSHKYKRMGLTGNVTNLNCNKYISTIDSDLYDVLVGAFLICYVSLVLLSSVYEGIARYQTKNVYERIIGAKGGTIIRAFSIPYNWQRLNASNNNTNAEKLRSIQGIRFYNMICVILAHTIMMTFAGPVLNTLYTEQMTGKPLNMFIANGTYAVQTFFVISGWLLSYHFFEMMKNRKIFHLKYLLLALFNRYIRLTPTLAVMIAFQSTWLRHFGTGPKWDTFVGEEFRNCRTNWWTNILYINNYVDKKNMCLQQTWYIAADTQLYIFSLILLTFLWKYEKNVKSILGTTMVVGLIIPGTIAYFYNYDIIIHLYPEILYNLEGIKEDAWFDLYASGHSNITGYTIGLTFGYIFYKYKNKIVKVSKIHIILWWLFTFGMCDFIVLIAGRMYEPGYNSTKIESALYWAFGKNVFALGIAITIYGFSLKIGWFPRWFCEWKAVHVIGRLTYSTYIVHSAVIRIQAGLVRTPVYINDYLLISTCLGNIMLSYLVGLLACLLFEMPISALLKLTVPQMTEEKDEVSFQKTSDLNDPLKENYRQNVCSSV